METVTPPEILDYWKQRLIESRRAVEVAEEMICYYGMQIALHRELDHKLSVESLQEDPKWV